MAVASVQASQVAEFSRTCVVMIYRPEYSTFLSSIHPAGSLFEQPSSAEMAAREHENYQQVMEKYGIKVYEVNQILMFGCEEDAQAMEELRRLAMKCITYVLPQDQDSYYASEEYKLQVVRAFSVRELVQTVMINPTVHLRLDPRNTGVEVERIDVLPMGNCVFTRDQQITTKKGVVIGNFAATQRKKESQILEFALKKLGIVPIGQLDEYSTLEGGDFVILDDQTAALGVGLRSSYSGANYLMRNDMLGFPRFLVIKDIFDHDQDRMHLDCTFAPLHERLAVIDEEILRESKQRYVDEYIQDQETKQYKLSRANVDFQQYLIEEGYSLIKLPHKCQLQYGCNMLNLGLIDDTFRILSVDQESIDFINSSPVFQEYCRVNDVTISIEYLPFRSVTSMYGSLHCASQVLKRVSLFEDGLKSREPAIILHEPEAFDYFMVIPTFCNRPDLVEQAQQKYHSLRQEGKSVFLINKYYTNSFKPLSTYQHTHNVQDILNDIFTENQSELHYKRLTLESCYCRLR